MTSSKLLKIIFGVLLIVIVGELTILFLNLKSKPKFETFNEKLSENKPHISKTGQPLHESLNTSPPEYEKRLAFITPAFHPTILSYLGQLGKSENTKVFIIKEFKYKVIGVEPKGACTGVRRIGDHYPEEVCFPFAVKVKNKSLSQGYHWIYINEKRIAKTKVFIKTKNGEVPSSIYQIQPGDIILINEKWDPSIPFDINHFKDSNDKQFVEQTIIINRNT